MRSSRQLACLLVFPLVALATAARADSVLDEVPYDALGFVVVRSLSQTDAKAGRILSALGSRLPGPVTLLKSMTGLGAGLDQRRDLLIALLPPEEASRQFHLAVWLPVTDYDALVRSLDGDPGRRIAAVTLAGEDLLVVRRGDWAVVMDPDQRDRLEQLGAGADAPPETLDLWADWIRTNDATLVVLPAGRRVLWMLAAKVALSASPQSAPRGDAGNDLFGPPGQSAGDAGWSAWREQLRSTLAETPELVRWAAEAEGAACGIRIDDEGNTLCGLRVAISRAVASPPRAATSQKQSAAVTSLYESGNFLVTGSGRVSAKWAVPAVGPYLRQMASEVATQFGKPVEEADLAKLRQAVEKAVGDVSAFSVLTKPGAGDDGVFTNNFLALRVASPPEFLRRSGEIIDLWNAMLAKTEGAKGLVFQAKPIQVAGQQGTEYAIDMTALVGGPAIPEIKASMEKLFGPGGKFRLQCVIVDDQTVLLSAATRKQLAEMIDHVRHAPQRAAEPAETAEAAKLLAADRAWQVFVSPHGYSEWLRRQMDAILGPVIGGPVVPQFPESPPVGIAGGVADNVVWAEVALPIETIRGYGKFSHR